MTPTTPSNDTAAVRGVRTGIQAILGLLITFVTGLVLAVWNVPGVPEAALNFISNNLPQVLLAVGIPTGLTSFVWNVLRKDVRNF